MRSNVNVLLAVFFDFDGIVRREFSPQTQTINKKYYYLQVNRSEKTPGFVAKKQSVAFAPR